MVTEDEIAIVGAGCRFPGADNLDEFWKVLVNGENHVKDIPDSRWNNSAFYDEDQTAPGKIYVKKAGLLKNHDRWDNRLFGISEVEASRVDPQQRYVLECVHMALEDGGFTRKQMNGSKTGVIIGSMNDDYKAMASSDLMEVGGYTATGTASSVLAARVSYVYNLHGTCLTLDTACSSALIAIHLASQAIKTGDCQMMICGGVSSILSPDTFKALCEARMVSATGQCQSFCDTADGYARGEGCGVVILKGLKAAIKDGNKIWATIKTGSNQDGSIAKPMTAPSADQQVELLKQVYTTYNFSPSDIQYIEAHGTGTPRGDPTEVNALGTFFSSSRSRISKPLLVGSVKSNIGHTESAAGIAGLIKVLLMMKHGKYVPSLHVKPDKSNVNKSIKLSEYNLDIATSVQDFPSNKAGVRHACLNSFGFGGSNTHAILTWRETPNVATQENNATKKLIPICISGVDNESLKHNLAKFQADLKEGVASHQDMSYTSFHHRDIFQYRTLVYGYDIQEITSECTQRIGRITEIIPQKKQNMVFVFCGVGTTWTGMCQEMMAKNDVFRKTVDQIDIYLEPRTGWRIRDKFLVNTNYEDPFLNHIAIFSVQVALTEVWKSFGIIPDAIVGQSVGEVAAAYAANLLSLEDAVKVIYVRSEILSRQSGGSMTVVGNMNIKEIENICSKYEDKVCIAVYSSPVACTLSGSTEELKMLTDSLRENVKDSKMFIRELKVKCAYHSPLLQGCMDEIRTRIDTSLKKGNSTHTMERRKVIPMISTMTGEPAVPTQIVSGNYWAMNIRQPVKFMQSIKQVFDEDRFNVYLEIGPRPVLRAHLSNILEGTSRARTIPSMLSNQEVQSFYRSLSEIFEIGRDIDNSSFNIPNQCSQVSIPKYSFNNTADLFIPIASKQYLDGYTIDNSHMFVQTAKRKSDMKFTVRVDVKSTPFVYDHFLSEKVVVPGATYLETGFQIGKELFKKPVDRLSVSCNFVKTFSPSASRDSILNVEISMKSSEDVHFSVLNAGNILANGTVSERKIPTRDSIDIDYLKVQCPNYKTVSECYASLAKFNFRYGESLSLIKGAWVSKSEMKCLTEIYTPENFCEELTKTHFHPAIIDSVFQIFGILVNDVTRQSFVVPKGVSGVVVNKPMEPIMYGYGEEVKTTGTAIYYNAVLLSKNGSVIAEFENFFTKIISSDMSQQDKSYTYALNWSEVEDFQTTSNVLPPKDILLYSSCPNTEWLQEIRKLVTVIPESIGEKAHVPPCESIENMIAVYHVSGFNSRCNDVDTQEIFNGAIKRFFDLKKVLAAFSSSDTALPIAVVTENTQQCPCRQTACYYGSELWGMLRSAVLEGVKTNVKLIDIDRDNIDVKALLKLLSSQDENEIEFALSGSTLYKPVMRTNQEKLKSKRHINFESSDELAICSTKQNEIHEPYLLLSNKMTDLSNTVSVTIDSLTDHNSDIYSKTLENIVVDDLLLHKHGEEGFQVIAIEGRGRTEKSNCDVSFLYPVNAATTVDIPKDHIVNKSDCPTDSSGILILTNILVHLASSVKGGSDVLVIKRTEEIDIGLELFTRMMLKKNCITQSFTTERLLSEGPSLESRTLIITTTISIENWKIMINVLKKLKGIISINIFLPEQIRLWLIHTYPHIKMTSLPIYELFSIDRIRDAMPKIKECVRQLTSHTVVKETNQFLLELPMKTLFVKEKMNGGSMKCFCSNLNLFRSQACYVIVGGLTGLGWKLLQLMVEMGAGILVTLSRRIPSNIVQNEIDKLQTVYRCRIVSLQTDIADFNSVQRSFSEIHHMFPDHPIKGVFHGAGILSDSILENLDEQKVKDVLKPKILGTLNLHIASLNCPLDYFVVHSSIVSVIGNPGQCNYAAANSFIDSFALYRRSKGLPAQSINWGALSVGMAVDNNEIKLQLKRSGFNTLDHMKIRELFLEAMINDITSVVYADIEWEKLLSLSTLSMKSAKYREFSINNAVISHASSSVEFDTGGFDNLNKDGQMEIITRVLKEIITQQLVVDDISLDYETSITAIGIDSMAAMSLSNRIDEVFDCRISLVILLSEGTTLLTIADYIRHHVTSSLNEIDRGHSEDGSHSQMAFNSKEFTFMQLDFLEKYKHHRSDPYYLRVIDVEITELKLHIDDWYEILRHVLKINPELRRKVYFSETGDVSVESLTEDSQEIDITKIPDITLEDTRGTDVRLSLKSDIHGCLPVSFKLSESKKSTILRVITHALVIDMRGLSLLCRDIEATTIAYIYKTELPKRPPIDIRAAVKAHIYPKMNTLGNYWKTYLEGYVNPVTLGLGPNLQTVDERFCSIAYVTIPQETVFAIKKHIAKAGITLYGFFMSVYQLGLHIGSNSSVVGVGTAADMRLHVPELTNVITRCVNYLPIIANINDEARVDDFIQDNSKSLTMTTQNGAYPNSLIREILKTTETRDNICRHFLAMNDMAEINKVTEEEKSRASIRQVWHMRHNRETFVYVKYDMRKASIKLEIGHNTRICGPYGQKMTENMLRLAEEAMLSGHKRISVLRDELTCSTTKPSNASDSGSHGRTSGLKNVLQQPKSKPVSMDLHKTQRQLVTCLDEVNTQQKNIVNKTTQAIRRFNVYETNKRFNERTERAVHCTDKDVIITDQFDKETSHGWDHKVQVKLCVIDGRVVLEWAKKKPTRKNKPRMVDLIRSRDILLRDLNGLTSLLIVLDNKILAFKTPHRHQAEQWFDIIQGPMRRTREAIH